MWSSSLAAGPKLLGKFVVFSYQCLHVLLNLLFASVPISELFPKLTGQIFLVFDIHLGLVARRLEVLYAAISLFPLLHPVLHFFVEELLVDVKIAILDHVLSLVVQLSDQRLY